MSDNKNTNDEINLIELMQIISRRISQFFAWINGLISFAFKNWIVLFLALLIGSFAGFYLKNSFGKKYSSKVVLESKYVKNNIISELISSLENAIDDDNVLFFEQNNLPKIGEELLTGRSIGVEFKPFSNDDDSLTSNAPFYIELSSEDGQKLPEIQNEIVKYLSSNSFIELRSRQSISRNNNLLVELNREITSLDSIKNIVKTIDKVKTLSGKEGAVPYIDPTVVYQEKMALIRNKIDIQVRLLDQEILKVISPAMAKNKPDVSKKKSGAFAGLILMFLTFIVAYRRRTDWGWVRK